MTTGLRSSFRTGSHKSTLETGNHSKRRPKSAAYSEADLQEQKIDYGVKIQEFLMEFYSGEKDQELPLQAEKQQNGGESNNLEHAQSPEQESEIVQGTKTENTEINREISENKSKIGRKPTKSRSSKPSFEAYKADQALEIRGFWGINEKMYISSLCDRPFISIKSEGQSGALFFKSADESYLIKTITKDESKFLKAYQDHYLEKIVKQNKDSLLTKYLEHFKIKIEGKKFYMVVMNNLFVAVQPRQYDLKGSTIGRETKQARINSGFCVFKDMNFINDFKDQIGLLNESHKRIVELLEHDAKFLEELKVIDYSLLLGVVKRDDFGSIKMIINDDSGKKILNISPDKENNGAEAAEGADQAEKPQGDTGKRNLFVPPGVIFGLNRCSNQKLILFAQIIDTLIQFKAFKKSEYIFKKVVYYKKMQNDADATYSVVPPKVYRQRFVSFMLNKVFANLDDKNAPGNDDEFTMLSRDTIKFVGNLTYNSQEFVNYTAQMTGNTQTNKAIAENEVENEKKRAESS